LDRIQNEPDKAAWITGNSPTPAELEWARFIEQTPHYVLSSTVTSALWPKTSFVRGLEEIAASSSSAARTFISLGCSNYGELVDAGWWMNSGLLLSADSR